jgi:hypothetical protein
VSLTLSQSNPTLLIRGGNSSIKTASNPAVVPRGQKDDIHCQASASQQGDLRAEETAFDLTPARLPSYNISATTEDNLELRNAATLN